MLKTVLLSLPRTVETAHDQCTYHNDVHLAEFQYVVEKGDITDRQSEDLDLGKFLVGRQSRQHAPQTCKRRIERLDANSLPRRVRCPVALRSSGRPACDQQTTAAFNSVEVYHFLKIVFLVCYYHVNTLVYHVVNPVWVNCLPGGVGCPIAPCIVVINSVDVYLLNAAALVYQINTLGNHYLANPVRVYMDFANSLPGGVSCAVEVRSFVEVYLLNAAALVYQVNTLAYHYYINSVWVNCLFGGVRCPVALCGSAVTSALLTAARAAPRHDRRDSAAPWTTCPVNLAKVCYGWRETGYCGRGGRSSSSGPLT